MGRSPDTGRSSPKSPGQTGCGDAGTELILGPLLRHVGRLDATVWVEMSRPRTVLPGLGDSERTRPVAGHHYALVVLEDFPPVPSPRIRCDRTEAWSGGLPPHRHRR
jgi:hypothetical protein